MGGTYRRLPSASRRGEGVRTRAWVLLRRAAVRLYAARRSWAARCGAGARRLTWAGLCGRGAAVAAPPRRSSAAAGAGTYDSASYARNFDDGVWKVEEGVFWRTGSVACRFAHHASANTTTMQPAPATGTSISSSTN